LNRSQNTKIATGHLFLQSATADKTGSTLFHSEDKDVKTLPQSGSEIVVVRADVKAQELVVTGEIVQGKK
jgi:hypothetical protein